MQTSIENLENCKTVLTLKADSEEWKAKIEKAYNKLEGKVTLPGFRKGKAPKEMLRSKVNPEDVFNEAINSYLNEKFSKVITENNLHPLIQPSVDVTKISFEEFECKITVIGEPKVELGKYKGIEIAKTVASVSDQEIDDEITKLQKRNAEIVVKEDGVASKGDVVTIDFEGFCDGVAFEGGKANDYDLELGSNTFIPGFEDQIVGMKVKEQKDVNVTFPQNYVENLKGKDATFKVSVKAIKTKVYPEINDDLALDANFDDVDNLASLKEHYRKQILENKENNAKTEAYNKLMDTIIADSKIDLAKEIVDDEVHHNLENIESRLASQGLTLESYLNMLSMKKEEMMAKLEEDCTKNLKYIFTLLAIAKEEKIEVTDEDFTKAYQDMASQYNMSVEDVEKAFTNRKDALANDLLTQKVSEFLKKENNI